MPSPALAAYGTRVDERLATLDASALSAGAKATVRGWIETFRSDGERLYLAGIKEAAEHWRRHVLAEAVARDPAGTDTALQNRVAFIMTLLDRVKNANDSLALSIADGLD